MWLRHGTWPHEIYGHPRRPPNASERAFAFAATQWAADLDAQRWHTQQGLIAAAAVGRGR